MNDCSGLRGLVYLPAEAVGAHPPVGWQNSPTSIAQIRLQAFSCTRISFGLFERGPINLILETHDNLTPVGNCTKGEFARSEVLTQIWLSDMELTAALQTAQIPAKFDEIKFSESLSAGVVNRTFEFGTDEPSSLQMYNLSGPADQTETSVDRFFWANEYKGVSYLDFELATNSDALEPQHILGSLGAPFLYAATGAPMFAGYGGGFVNSNAVATIQNFGDAKCDVRL